MCALRNGTGRLYRSKLAHYTEVPNIKPHKLIKQKIRNRLEEWEIAIVKAMLARGGYADQDIQSYFTRPTRTVNLGTFCKIRNRSKHKSIHAATQTDLDEFLSTWPNIDPDIGLNRHSDELLIKAREAMIAAVNTFNSAGLTFRAELFIVTCVIAWTYLLHAWFRREGIDFRYKTKTKSGAEKYWELGKCLKHEKCPISAGVKKNLEFLLGFRNEIEHRVTGRIDDEIGSALQACCINFDSALKNLFGSRYGLERCLPIALQFVSFGPDQRIHLKRANNLPPHISTFISVYNHGLTDEQFDDPAFRYRVAFIPVAGNRASNTDFAVKFVDPDSDDGAAIHNVLLKEVNKKRYTATKVVRAAHKAGYPSFSMHHHTVLWKNKKAKDPKRGYGCQGDYKSTWVWFENWVNYVLDHCKKNSDKYQI